MFIPLELKASILCALVTIYETAVLCADTAPGGRLASPE